MRWLTAAGLTIVDQFERDGRRYLLMREDSRLAVALLSRRERQAVALLCQGHTNKEIAFEMGLSASTVGTLLWRAASKLGTRSRRQLMETFAS
jgi:DNA-binding NarL/FixJ family response regulator